MRPALLVLLGTLGAAALPRAALAQRIAEGPPREEKINAIERGFFLESDFGLGMLATKIDGHSYGLSPLIGFFGGFDITPFVSISLGASTLAAPGPTNSVSASGSAVCSDSNPRPCGDLFFAMPELQVQVALLSTERNALYVRGAGGFGIGTPSDVLVNGKSAPFGGNGPVAALDVGFEHHTTLRHFSIGIQAGAVLLFQPTFAPAIELSPTLKYTF